MVNQESGPISSFKEQIFSNFDKEFLISRIDAKGTIVFVNDLFCEISGYNRDELIGKKYNVIHHSDMPDEISENLWETISKKKDVWRGFFKNKKKDGSYYWVLSLMYPIFKDLEKQELEGFYSLQLVITDLMKYYEEEQFNHKLFEILNYDYKSENLKDSLQKALDFLFDFRWLESAKKAGIMLWNPDTRELEMFVHKGLDESLLRMCNRVPEGRCLCGKTAYRKEMIFKSHVDEEHENHYENMKPHGHYHIPLLWNEELQGVLFLYLRDGAEPKKIEINFLKQVGLLLGSIIKHSRSQRKVINLNKKLEKTNQNLQNMANRNFNITQLLGRYTPQSTLEHITKVVSMEKEEHFYENKFLHYLFLDIVNFTGYSENREPKEIFQEINRIFSYITNIIYENSGDIDKFIGDSIFAFFHDADKCLDTALIIQETFNNNIINPTNFQCRIGIHSGHAMHGNLGNEIRKEYALLGDSINTTQRIERASKPGKILVSEFFISYLKYPDRYQFSRRMILKTKGKKENVKVRFVEKSLQKIQYTKFK